VVPEIAGFRFLPELEMSEATPARKQDR
jgi:hypothetical protein